MKRAAASRGGRGWWLPLALLGLAGARALGGEGPQCFELRGIRGPMRSLRVVRGEQELSLESEARAEGQERTQRTLEVHRLGIDPGRPDEITLRHVGEPSPWARLVREGPTIHLERAAEAGSKVPILVGNGAFFLHGASPGALFVVADLVPRIPGSQRSVDWIDAHSGARERRSIRYLGVEEVDWTEDSAARSGARLPLHRFELSGSPPASIHLDRDGSWWRFECGDVLLLRTATAPPRAAGEAAAAADDARRAQHFETTPVALRASDGARLSGTLRRPREGKARALALLIAGSGPQDRDGNGPGSDPPRGCLLRDLACDLADAGISSLCWDERGVGQSTGDWWQVGPERQAMDAGEWLTVLRARGGDADLPLVLLGHSEGAAVAALAQPALQASALVLLGASRVDLVELLRFQIPEILRVQGATQAAIDAACSRLEAFLESLPALLADGGNREGFFRMGGPSFWREHTSPRLAPARLYRDLDAPLLWLQGGSDRHVPALSPDALPGTPHPLTELRRFPDLDHFLMYGTSGDPARFLEPDRRIAAAVTPAILEWLARVLGS